MRVLMTVFLVLSAGLAPVAHAQTKPAPLPLFDTHVHYSASAWQAVPLARALAQIREAGTLKALVSSTPDTGTERLYRAAPGLVVPELRPYRTSGDMGSWHRDPATIAYLLERLKLGIHKGIGEFHLHGDDARSDVIKRVVALAVERKLHLHAHSDAAAIRHLFAHDKRVLVLWAHAGFEEPAAVGKMLDAYPNLCAELAILDHLGGEGGLDPAWRALFLRHPDRFMIGTDSYVVSRWERMPEILANVRRWLATLPRPVAEKLAWRNAARFLGVPETAFGPGAGRAAGPLNSARTCQPARSASRSSATWTEMSRS